LQPIAYSLLVDWGGSPVLWVIPRCQAASACSPFPDTRWYFSMVRIHWSIFMPFTKGNIWCLSNIPDLSAVPSKGRCSEQFEAIIDCHIAVPDNIGR